MPDDVNSAAVDVLSRWFRSPVAFVREALHAEPEPWQTEVLVAAAEASQTAIVGSKGTGKSCVLAWLLTWFLATRPHANISVTSVSASNLRDGLWKETARWLAASPLLTKAFEWQAQRIVHREHPATWWASARTWSKSADAQQQADTLAGLHAERMLFVVDEAGSIPQSVVVTAQAALSSGKECRLIIAGNPTSTNGPLYAAAVTHRHHWGVFKVTGDPDDPKRSARVSVEWARQQIQQYGESNPWVRVNVFAQFPETSLNALLSPVEVEAAMHRYLREDAFSWCQKRLGVDPARFGDDRTVIAPRQGKAIFKPVVMRGARSTEIAARVAQGVAKWNAELVFVDDSGGWGMGTVDQLMAAGVPVVPVVFSDKAIDPRFTNRRAETWFAMADAIKNGAALPNLPELVGELAEVQYSFSNGRFLLESKDQLKARIGRSPDIADAIAVTYALADMPAAIAGIGQVGKVLHDGDPFAERRRA
ncbi:MAG: hypothetical protein ACE148_14475 [Vicinamibacterales bacterium]